MERFDRGRVRTLEHLPIAPLRDRRSPSDARLTRILTTLTSKRLDEQFYQGLKKHYEESPKPFTQSDLAPVAARLHEIAAVEFMLGGVDLSGITPPKTGARVIKRRSLR